MSCSIRIRVTSSGRPRRSSVSRSRSPNERPDAGSSSSISFGSTALAIPTSSCRCSPWERSRTNVSTLSPRRTRSAAARARSRTTRFSLWGTIRQTPAVATDDREKDVVLDREAGEEAGLLICPRQTELRANPGREVRDVSPHHLDRSGGRGKVTGHEVEERGLAGPVRAEDRAAFAIGDVEIDLAYGLNSPNRLPTPRKRRITVSGSGTAWGSG